MLTPDHIVTANGEPVLAALHAGPEHDEIPTGLYLLTVPVTEEMAEQLSDEITAVVEAVSHLVDEDVPDALRSALASIREHHDDLIVPIGEPFELCWN